VLGNRAKGARVSHVDYVNVFVHHKDHDRARTCLVVRLVRRGTHQLQVGLFRLERALPAGLFNVGGELWLQDNVVVQVVFQILRTFAASVPVIDAKDLQLRPLVGGNTWNFLCWLDHVEDD